MLEIIIWFGWVGAFIGLATAISTAIVVALEKMEG